MSGGWKARLRTAAKALLALGGILLGVCWLYASNRYPAYFGSIRGRRSLLDDALTLLNLVKNEPSSAVLLGIALSLLLLGLLFYWIGREQ